MNKLLLTLAFAVAATACTTQAPAPSAYVGQENRDIKALSPAEVTGLLAGKGLGYAKSAELNGYPGPVHVLELSDKLALSPQQVEATEAIFARMQTSAKEHGAALLQAERELEALFQSRQVTALSLEAAVDRVALQQAKVRNTHLVAHLDQTKLLKPEQIAHYNALRGYANAHGHGGH
jgi:Spy/CpxP family protein refolding chaperone